MRILLLSFVAAFSLHFALPTKAFELSQQIKSTGLRTVVISTVDGEEPVCESVYAPEGSWGVGITNVNKVPGSVVIIDCHGEENFNSGSYVKKESGMSIKVRGNTSAMRTKKPYKIKLEKKADLLCRGNKDFNDKNWILITHPSNIYELGFLLGKWIGMAWAPEYEYVHVVINEVYRGVYLLTESVERNDKCRIRTADSGFIAERDPYWWNEDGQYLLSGWNTFFNWTMKYPDFEDLDEASKEFVHRRLLDFENIITTPDFAQMIDVDSFCRWLIAQDIMGTRDGGGTNFYLAQNDDSESSKLFVPVLWDLDSGEETTEAWSAVHNEGMIKPLFENPDFRRRYCELYRELSPVVFEKMESLAENLEQAGSEGFNQAALLDCEIWGKTGEGLLSTSGNARDMKAWFPARKLWLDAEVSKIESQLSAVNEIEAIPDSYIEVYTFAGLKIYSGSAVDFTPSGPGLFIIKSSGSAKKLLIP